GNAPAWRGSTIALLVRYPLKEVGNTIAGLQVRAELGSDIQDPTGIAGIHLQSVTSDPDAFRRACYYMTSTDARVVAYKDDPTDQADVYKFDTREVRDLGSIEVDGPFDGARFTTVIADRPDFIPDTEAFT